ncbi:MAG: cyclic nucleotide-binding domain-containing protein [Ktedonobacterales bacterium]|nr:cyclic nucleotide-binding domain-containing protein [Ktedonobacterales bacterium]
MSVVDYLTKVPLFTSLDRKDVLTLAASARERQYQPGEEIVREGDTGVGLFVLTAGQVRVTQVRAGTPFDLGVLGDGQVFGELSLLDDLPRTATITAIEPSTVIIVPIWDFRAALRDNPSMALSMLRSLSQRIRRIEQAQRTQ